MTRNDRLFRLFDKGKAKDSLLGENEYFIPDVTYRDKHNSVLVLDQLILWCEENNKYQEIDYVLTEIFNEKMLIDDNEGLLDFVMTLFVVYSYLKNKSRFNKIKELAITIINSIESDSLNQEQLELYQYITNTYM